MIKGIPVAINVDPCGVAVYHSIEPKYNNGLAFTHEQLKQFAKECFEAGHLKGTDYIPEVGEIEKDFDAFWEGRGK